MGLVALGRFAFVSATLALSILQFADSSVSVKLPAALGAHGIVDVRRCTHFSRRLGLCILQFRLLLWHLAEVEHRAAMPAPRFARRPPTSPVPSGNLVGTAGHVRRRRPSGRRLLQNIRILTTAARAGRASAFIERGIATIQARTFFCEENQVPGAGAAGFASFANNFTPSMSAAAQHPASQSSQ